MGDASKKGTGRKRGEHLRAFQFQPGRSGNPNGRPRDSMTVALRRALSQELRPGLTVDEGIIQVLIRKALRGSLAAIALIYDRAEGRVRQAIDLTVLKSEQEKYELRIQQFISVAKAEGITVSRAEAVQYLGAFGDGILDVIGVSNGRIN